MANKPQSIAFIDAGIEASSQLAKGIALDAEIVILSPTADGVEQITAALKRRPQIRDMYVIAHGAPGQLTLGNGELSLTTLPTHRAALQQWGTHTQIENIYLYGCCVAAGDAGAELVTAVRSLTQANIAASTHVLGHADKGGDWTLDAVVGEVQPQPLLTAEAIATYTATLGDDIIGDVVGGNIDSGTPITPGTPLDSGNASAGAQTGEPFHDPTLAGADPDDQFLANDSVWWSWTADLSGSVNVNTDGSSIGTVLAVYSGVPDATDFSSFQSIDTDFTATGGAAGASVTFNAVNGTTYYFAVDGTGFQKTADNATGITIELDVPPVITPAQVFTVAESTATTPSTAPPVDGTGSSAVEVTGTAADYDWAITAGNPDNDGDGTLAFGIDGSGVLSVTDPGDLDFEGFPANYTLTVSATDGAGFTDKESVFIQVTDEDEAPAIKSLSAPGTVNEGQSFTLSGQVADPDIGDSQTVLIDWDYDGTTFTTDATASVDNSGEFAISKTYTDDFSGTIAVKAQDSTTPTALTSNIKTRNITVNNVAPEITASIPLNFEVAEDGSQSLLLTASDPGSADTLTWSLGTPSDGGTLVDTDADNTNPTQVYTYTPALNFNGTETFEVQVQDDDGDFATAQFTVTVTPEPDAPTALNLTASDNTIDEGDTITLNGSFKDPDVGDTFTVTINWGDGTDATVLNTADLTFNPATDTYSFNADHEFLTNDDVSVVVTVQDSFGESTIASEAITVNNLPPEISPASTFISIDEDTSGTIEFTASDTTATGFTWKISDAPDAGSATLASPTGTTQTITYTPEADFFGGDNFVVQVSDGEDPSFANVAVIVKAVNDDPFNLTVNPSATSINEGGSITLAGSFRDVDNSTEPLIDDVHSITIDWGDGDIETFTDTDTLDGTPGGTPIFSNTGAELVSFAGLEHQYADGTETYTVKITIADEAGAEVSTTQEIQVLNVAPVIDSPTTNPNEITVTEDTPFEFTVSATDVGVEDILTWNVFTAPTNGTVTPQGLTIAGDRTFTYTPDADFDGDGDAATFTDDTFTLVVSDGDGGFKNLVYNVNVDGVNDPPELIVGNFEVVEDQPLPITTSLLNAIDDQDSGADIEFVITGPGADSFLVDNDGNPATAPDVDSEFTLQDIEDGKVSFLYKNANNLGVDGLSFTVTVSDTEPLSDSQFVQIPPESFTAKNDAPAFVDQNAGTAGLQLGEIIVDENDSVLIDDTIIAATDEETDDANLEFTVSSVVGGQFIVKDAATGLFAPSNTFTQDDIDNNRVRFENLGSLTNPSYTIQVSDLDGRTATAFGGGTVNEQDDPPAITTNKFAIVEDVPLIVNGDVLNITDEDTTNGNLDITITDLTVGTFEVNGTASTTFTLQEVLNGDVTYTVANTKNYPTSLEGEPPSLPTFTIEVSDGVNPAVSEAANIVSFEAVNDAPVFDPSVDDDSDPTNGTQIVFTIPTEGTPFAIDNTVIKATDEESAPEDLTFTVTNLSGGDFRLNGDPTSTFTQADVNNGNVTFLDDGSGVAPEFTLTVQDPEGKQATADGSATITTPLNDAPVITVNNFPIVEGEPLTITSKILDATDIDSDDTNIKFTIEGPDADSFKVSGTVDNTFTVADIANNKVTFLYDGEIEPSFTIKASDQETGVTPAPAVSDPVDGKVTFTEVNDIPQFVDAAGDPITDNILPNFTVLENGSFTFNSADNLIIKATDGDLDIDDRDLVFEVLNVEGGEFVVSSGDNAADPATTFTQGDINFGRVSFRNDGSLDDFTYTLSVTDGNPDSVSIATGGGTVTDTNDVPEITTNQFEVVEDVALKVTPLVLNASDEDAADGPAQLTFTITGPDKDGFVESDGAGGFTDIATDQFTLEDVNNGEIFFLFENEDDLTDLDGTPIGPQFTIEVADDDGASDTEVGNIVSFTAKNDLPVLDETLDADTGTEGVQFEVQIDEGVPEALSATDINATDEETADANLTYTVTDFSGGTFVVEGETTNTFTQAQLNAGNRVFFVDDGTFSGAVGDSLDPFTIEVDDGDGGIVETTLTITFDNIVAASPEITQNAFDITEETQFQVTTDNLDATDADTLDENLTFTITGAAKDSFIEPDGAGGFQDIADDKFTLQDILDGKIFFNYAGEDTPEFAIALSDGLAADGTADPTADVTVDGNVVSYTPINDEPTLAIDLLSNATLDEGGSFFIDDDPTSATAVYFDFVDAEFDATPQLQAPEDIVYTYTATNGFFADAAGEEITSFTQADVAAGNVVQFIQDGSPAEPSFTVTVEDNGFTLTDGTEFTTSKSATFEVLASDFTLNQVNDAPVVEVNAFPIVEGEELVIDTSVLKISDEETLGASNLSIDLLDSTGTALTVAQAEALGFAAPDLANITYQDVVLGRLTLTYEGEDEPAFQIQVTDDGTPTGTTKSETVDANIISFENTNDAPVFVDQDTGTADIQLGEITVTEDKFDPTANTITTDIINATDVDSPDDDLTFTVSNVVGGTFRVGGITDAFINDTFTLKDIKSDLVFFINEGENTDNVPVGGTPNAISYDIKVSDGTDFTTNSGTGNITPVNDDPELVTNNFDVTEDVLFKVTTDQLDATDVDSAPDDLTFTITGTDSGSFVEADGTTPDTEFTLQDILDGTVFFKYTGEDTPEFAIALSDGFDADGTADPTADVTADGNVTFTPVNDEPTLDITIPDEGTTIPFIEEGGSFFIDDAAATDKAFFNFTDAEFDATLQEAADIVYTYTATNGFFADVDGNEIESFTQADVAAGDVVQFIHGGGEDAPTISVTVNDNGFTLSDGTEVTASKSDTVDLTETGTPTSPNEFKFVNVNDVPELILGAPITVTEGKTVVIGQGNLNASDVETNAFDLTFVVSEITNGSISTDGGLNYDTPDPADDTTFLEFTVQDVLENEVIFKHDDSAELDAGGLPTFADLAPSFTVLVRDNGADAGTKIGGGDLDPEESEAVTVDIVLNEFNDTPVLKETFGTADDGVPFEINEGQTLLLSDTNVNAIDPDTPPEELVYTVTNSVGGFFAFNEAADGSPADPPIETNTFTQAQVNDGQVVYVHEGDNTAPSYTLKVSDGNSADSEIYTPTLITQNDAPEIKLNTLTITEDTTVPITTSNLQASDEETGPANLTYSVKNLTNGIFLKDDGTGTFTEIIDSDTTDEFDLTDAFTQQDVIAGRIRFEYQGFGDEPTYTLTVEDNGAGSQAGIPAGALPSEPDQVKVAFTPVNDAPIASNLIPFDDGDAATDDAFGVFEVTQGGSTIITAQDILVVDEEDYRLKDTSTLADPPTSLVVAAGAPSRIVFTVNDVNNGFFSDGSTEIDPDTGLPVLAAIAEFTQADINQGIVSFVHDGSNTAPSYTLIATDQGLQISADETLAPKTFKFSVDLAANFTNANDAPDLGNNSLTIDEGETVVLEPTDLSASDAETNAFDLTFNIADITNGFFTVDGGTPEFFGDDAIDGTPIDPDDTAVLATAGSFTYEDVVAGRVSFTHDGSNEAPTYSVTVEDQVEPDVDGAAIETSPPAPADIKFNPENDAPTLVQADGTTPLVGLTVDEAFIDGDGNLVTDVVAVTLANIDAIDEESDPADLTFQVSEVEGGNFIDINGSITGTVGDTIAATDTFTRQDIINGAVAFESDDSNLVPSYKVTVTDEGADVDPALDPPLADKSSSETLTGTLNEVNDTPVKVTLGTIALTEQGEGSTVTIDDSILEFTDEESAAADLTYEVTAVDGGNFFLTTDLVNPIAVNDTFTQAQVNNSLVVFKDDGLDDDAPTFSLTLKDGGIEDPANPGTFIDFKTVDLTEADFGVAANFTPVNDAPVPGGADDPGESIPENGFIVLPFPTVTEGTPLDITQDIIDVTDEEATNDADLSQLVYTVSGTANVSFTNGATTGATSFTQADINNGDVELVPLNDQAPEFTLTLKDQGLSGVYEPNELSQTVVVPFEQANQDPEIVNNTLSPIEGQEVTLTQDNISASDREDSVTQLIFEVDNVVGGDFFLNGNKLNTATPINDTDGDGLSEFTITQISLGEVTFKDDGDETPPSYDLIVTDTDGAEAGPEAAIIDESQFPVDDPPVIDTADFSITEGQSLKLDSAILNTTDPDTADENLTYTVSGVTTGNPVAGGDFFLTEDVGGTVTSEIVTQFTQAQVANGAISFKPDGSDTAPSFKITVTDGTSSDTVVLTSDVGGGIDFEEVNDPPVAVNDNVTTAADTAANFNVTANDTDDGGTLTITQVNDGDPLPSGATVSIAGGVINYNPGTAFEFLAAGDTDTDTFTYTIADDGVPNNPPGPLEDQGTVTVTITGVNDAPEAKDDTASGFENAPFTINNLLDNDDDPDNGDELTITSVGTTGTTGSVEISADGQSVIYDPTGQFTLGAGDPPATDSFTYTISDKLGLTSTATVEVEINGVNDPPVAGDDSGAGFATNDNQSLTTPVLTDNDEDPDNDPFSIVKINDATASTGVFQDFGSFKVRLNADDTITFDPLDSFRDLSLGESTTQNITYTIQEDGGGLTDKATVSVVINGVNEAPTLDTSALTLSTDEDTPIALDLLDVTGASDIDASDTISLSNISAASFGTVSTSGNTFTYTPSQALTGSDSVTENLTFTISDNNNATASGTLTIDVTGINDPPIARNNSGSGFRTDAITPFTTGNVLGNDSDPEGGPLSLVNVNTSGVQGLLTSNGDGTFSYDPNGAFKLLPNGRLATDTFTYTIEDNTNLQDTATVSIGITGVMGSFFDFEQFLRYSNVNAVAPTTTLPGSNLPLAQLYDERFYLTQNPTIEQLVTAGSFSSGFDHFVNFGIRDGRNPSILFNEEYYLDRYPTIAAEVNAGVWDSGLEEFLVRGHKARGGVGRQPSLFFNPDDYVADHPGVLNLINSGDRESAFQEYIEFGIDRGRGPDLALFDEDFYLDNNPGLVDQIAAGNFADGFEHFVRFGQTNPDKFQPSVFYDEGSYLENNSGLVSLIGNGLTSGFQHYQTFGRFEGRVVF